MPGSGKGYMHVAGVDRHAIDLQPAFKNVAFFGKDMTMLAERSAGLDLVQNDLSALRFVDMQDLAADARRERLPRHLV